MPRLLATPSNGAEVRRWDGNMRRIGTWSAQQTHAREQATRLTSVCLSVRLTPLLQLASIFYSVSTRQKMCSSTCRLRSRILGAILSLATCDRVWRQLCTSLCTSPCLLPCNSLCASLIHHVCTRRATTDTVVKVTSIQTAPHRATSSIAQTESSSDD